MKICLFIHILTMAASALIEQSWEAVTDTVWWQRLKNLLSGPLHKNVTNPWLVLWDFHRHQTITTFSGYTQDQDGAGGAGAGVHRSLRTPGSVGMGSPLQPIALDPEGAMPWWEAPPLSSRPGCGLCSLNHEDAFLVQCPHLSMHQLWPLDLAECFQIFKCLWWQFEHLSKSKLISTSV